MTHKSSLHVGLNYTISPITTLKGCINDAKSLSQLFSSYGYYVMLRTDDVKKVSVPFIKSCVRPTSLEEVIYTTKFGMIKDMQNLVTNANGPIVFTFSGHGTQVKDISRDEGDALDEAIVPVDAPITGVITDDVIFNILKESSYPVFCLFDSCHSGSIADLPCSYDPKTKTITQTKEDASCKIVCISGCRDEETSADTENIESVSGNCGALTACFLAAVKSLPKDFTPKQLADDISQRLGKNNLTQNCVLSVSQTALMDAPLAL